jgi:hypothetical protein
MRSYNQDNVYAARVLALAKRLELADKGKVAADRHLLAFSATRTPGRGIRLPAGLQPLGSYLDALR